MRFRYADLRDGALDAAAEHFDREGFLMLEGVSDVLTPAFRPLLAEMLGVSLTDLPRYLDYNVPVELTVEARERLSRISTTPELRDALFRALEPVLLRLVGPLLHISRDFHGQFKVGQQKAVDHGGYTKDFVEVQSQYLLHQDFTGGRFPTSPAGVTLWVAQNSSPDFNLRLYPRSHRAGLLCERFLSLDDPKLEWLGAPLDIVAEEGTAVIFNALLLHSTSNPGMRRRISCDIRFFPMCGFLPSETHVLGANPLAMLRRRVEEETAPTLREPLLEVLAFLGEGRMVPDVEPLSILNWANYVAVLLGGDPDAALPHFERFANAERGWDPVERYTSKYHNRPVLQETLTSARRKVVAAEPQASTAALDAMLARLASSPAAVTT